MKWTDVKKDISSISQEDKNLIELTALLASLRKEKKMTQKELAEKVHVSQAQIARVEFSLSNNAARSLSERVHSV